MFLQGLNQGGRTGDLIGAFTVLTAWSVKLPKQGVFTNHSRRQNFA